MVNAFIEDCIAIFLLVISVDIAVLIPVDLLEASAATLLSVYVFADADADEIEDADVNIASDFAKLDLPLASVAASKIASDLAANIAEFLFVVSVKIEDNINEDTASIALWFVKY